MHANSNTPPVGNPTAALEAANTYTDMWGNVIAVASLLWLEDGRYYDVEEGEHRDCSRYCINAEEVGADGESVWLNEDYQEVDPDAYDYDDTEDDEEVDE